MVCGSGSKPTVIKYEQLNSALLRLPRDGYELLSGEIKICRFPVIDKDWSWLVSLLTSCKPLLIQLVEGLAHLVESLI